MPELARAASGKDTLVFHCALSQVDRVAIPADMWVLLVSYKIDNLCWTSAAASLYVLHADAHEFCRKGPQHSAPRQQMMETGST
ncbi:hypothetical protein BAE44_0015638 [Dichanthelium oligosanthes]|uniref:Uncharacterized protein n=1 Tax=Dichanthelium oligosanthes TaxID=888268 RepID=A0A1E5VE41_9POAL|nr:hypothetical protein BAE44_0015638 [Dichanthelium oligosanthes]